jgi:hypothetical protein
MPSEGVAGKLSKLTGLATRIWDAILERSGVEVPPGTSGRLAPRAREHLAGELPKRPWFCQQ